VSDRRLISSGSPFEAQVGFSRAVVVDRHVYVAGTAPVMPEGQELPGDAYGQAVRCLDIIEAALAEAGARLDHVVRTRMYLTRLDAFDGAGRAHGERFGSVRPANTTVLIAGLVRDEWLVEIEAEAFLHDA